MTNPFRRRDVASLLEHGEAWAFGSTRYADVTDKAMSRRTMWLGVGCSDGNAEEAERPVRHVRAGQESEPSYDRCDPVQTDRETAGQHKPALGKGGRKVDA